MKRVIIESPYAGDVEQNTAYARACLLDSLKRGEAPIASHLLHTQVLDDLAPCQRRAGIEAGLAWYPVADLVVFYVNRGWSSGMGAAALRAMQQEIKTEERSLGGEWAGPAPTPHCSTHGYVDADPCPQCGEDCVPF